MIRFPESDRVSKPGQAPERAPGNRLSVPMERSASIAELIAVAMRFELLRARRSALRAPRAPLRDTSHSDEVQRLQMQQLRRGVIRSGSTGCGLPDADCCEPTGADSAAHPVVLSRGPSRREKPAPSRIPAVLELLARPGTRRRGNDPRRLPTITAAISRGGPSGDGASSGRVRHARAVASRRRRIGGWIADRLIEAGHRPPQLRWQASERRTSTL